MKNRYIGFSFNSSPAFEDLTSFSHTKVNFELKGTDQKIRGRDQFKKDFEFNYLNSYGKSYDFNCIYSVRSVIICL